MEWRGRHNGAGTYTPLMYLIPSRFNVAVTMAYVDARCCCDFAVNWATKSVSSRMAMPIVTAAAEGLWSLLLLWISLRFLKGEGV